jgi:hypothetical protein
MNYTTRTPSESLDLDTATNRAPSSWVVIRRADGVAVLETYQRSVVDKVNRGPYRVETIGAYLQRINREAKEA